MSVTVTQNISYGNKAGSSFKKILSGIGLFLGSIALLFWNEGNYVHTDEALAEGESIVESDVDNTTVNPEMEGKLVHMTGQAVTTEIKMDNDFNISLNGIKLRRNVQYYQWVEHEERHERDNADGSTTVTITYTYTKEWVDKPVSHNSFQEPQGHENHVCAEGIHSDKWVANTVTFGAFTLNSSQIGRINAEQDYPLTDYAVPARWSGSTTISGNTLYISKRPERNNGPLPVAFTRGTPEQPSIGDLRISWRYVPAKVDATLVAVQTKQTFTPYVVKETGYTVDLFSCGIKNCAEMFVDARNENESSTWALRVVGVLMMYTGLSMVFGPLSVVFAFIPGVREASRILVLLLSVILTCILSTLVIAVAWLYYRPVVGIGLLTGVIILYIVVRRMFRRKA